MLERRRKFTPEVDTAIHSHIFTTGYSAFSASMNSYLLLTDTPRRRKAAAFPKNSVFIRNSRPSRSSSRSRARSETLNAGSSSTCSVRYLFTQFPRVPSLTCMSRAISAIGRDVSITIFTASSLNSGVNFLRRSCIDDPPFRFRPEWVRCPEPLGHPTSAVHRFAEREDIPWVDFKKGQRKDDVMGERLASFTAAEGVVFIGRAQEKTPLFRTEKRRDREGRSYPWIVKSTGVVNQFYYYCVDADFGPFFLKFCSYFPFNGKLCINGNHWAQRQAAKAGIGFTPLDNAFAAVEDPAALQAICDQLGPDQIDALLRLSLIHISEPTRLGMISYA